MNLKEWIRGILFPDESEHDRKKEILDLYRYGITNQYAGVDVTDKSVATHGDVFTCVRILSTALGQLPLKLYRETEDGVEDEVRNTVLANIFTKRPNFYQTTQEWIEQCVSNLALRGNFYCEIVRNRYGNIAQLIPFYRQESVDVIMLTDGNIQYTYTTNDSRTGIYTKQTFAQNEVLHIKMNSYDGYIGISAITHATMDLGIAIATETHTAAIFENDATPRMVLESDQTFGDDLEAFERMRDSWNATHKGPKRSGKTAILEYGFKAKPLQMTPADTQLIDQRILSRSKVSAMFGVPSHRLNDSAAGKYGNVEQNNKAFYTDTLAPYITRIESQLNLLLPQGYRIVIDDAHFTRGDSMTQTETISKQMSMGIISVNEAREALGLQPVEGGDVYATNTNNLTFGTWEEYEPPQPEPVAGSQPTEDQSSNENQESTD